MSNKTTNLSTSATFEVAIEEAGTRIDRFIAEKLSEVSRSRVKALIESAQISIVGEAAPNPSQKVRTGQIIHVLVPPPAEDHPTPQAMDLDILFEDDHLIVIDKPAGMVVHPAPGNRDMTLVNALLAHCGDSLAGIGGVRRPGIVHRIDKETSGIVVVAKTDRTHAALSAAFAAHSIERAYHAVVWGMPSPRFGTINLPIGRSTVNRKKMAIVESGKQAVTHYEVIRPLGIATSLVECRLETGRTHQIRVHMTEIGHALVGDPVYGRARNNRVKSLTPRGVEAVAGFQRQALHACLLGFDHPVSGEHLAFTSEYPADLALLISGLE